MGYLIKAPGGAPEGSSGRRWLAAQIACLVAICVLAACWIAELAHPYYFGDELTTFLYAGEPHAFASAFELLNQYKPRLVFNSLWSLIADWQVPRLYVAALLAALWCGVIVLAFRIARSGLKASVPVALLVAAIAGFSRFSVMLRYDYLAGTIEIGSLLFFLVALHVVLVGAERGFRPRATLVAVVAATLAVLVHERYIAGTIGLAAALAAVAWFHRRAVAPGPSLLAALLVAVVPFGVFAVATRLLADLPMATGTAGQQVVVGLDNATIALQYIGNVFLGTNHGQPWFVGLGLQQPVLIGVVTVASLLWIALAVHMIRQRTWSASTLLVLSPLVAMIAVATLPGADRQEARWMVPVALLAAFLIVAVARKRWAILALAITLSINAVYLVLGGQGNTFNILASNYSRAIGEALASTAIKEGTGVVAGVPEPDLSWIIRGVNFGPIWSEPPGRLYAKANGLGVELVPEVVAGAASPRADFGLLREEDEDGRMRFRVLGGGQIRALTHPDQIADSEGTALGHGSSWSEWRWKSPPTMTDEGVLLPPGFDGFRPVPTAALANRALIYRAKASGDARVPMRLQVNWTDGREQLVSAVIQVVDVDGEWRNYTMLVNPPPGAVTGNVYATLHDGASGQVTLGSIRVLD
ncbi:hypothetical protein [Pseudoxanthomonas mexicana]